MMFWRIFRLELRVAFRHSAEIANPLWFFLIVITLFPLSIDLLQQLRQQNNSAEVEHIREADTQAADGEVARLKQRQIDYRVIVGQLPDNQEADSHHRPVSASAQSPPATA